MRTTFLDVYVKQVLEKDPELDIDKARKYFTGLNEFILDVWFRDEDISDESVNKFYSMMNLDEKASTLLARINQQKDHRADLLKCFGIWTRKTLLGMGKFCIESEDWTDPVAGDDVYRLPWFHYVIANIVDWGLYAMLNPKKADQRTMALSIPPQHGKLLPADSIVLTTKGWKKHGELAVGDYVFSPSGKPVRVEANSGEYDWEVIKITFNDKNTIECAREHLWDIWYEKDDKKGRINAVLETQEIANIKHRRSPYIKATQCLDIDEANLPIDPYVLGVWLGDGTASIGKVTKGAKDFSHFSHLFADKNIGRISEVTGEPIYYCKLKDLDTKTLKENNLRYNKHIPDAYLLSSRSQRLSLLQGIMDTDGTVDTRGNCAITQKNKGVADNLFTIMCSLGLKPRMRKLLGKINKEVKGEYYSIEVNPDRDFPMFRLPRKLERLQNKTTQDRSDKYKHFIKNISTEGRIVKGNCIQVEGGMYLAGRNLIPTHNSFLVSGWSPALFLGNLPKIHGLLVTYSEDFSAQVMERDFLNTISSKGYSMLFKNLFACQLSPEIKEVWRKEGRKMPIETKSLITTTRGGRLFAGSLRQITGKRAKCLPKGTLISTDRGQIPIENICGNPRVKVWTYSHNSEKIELSKIVAWQTSRKQNFVTIDAGHGGVVRCTDDHRVYVVGKGYIEAKDIKVGDMVRSPEQPRVVNSISTDCQEEEVYDIQTERNHNFFANGILVHNCLILDDPIPDFETACSQQYVEKLNANVEASMETRMHNDTFCAVVQTRWVSIDPIGTMVTKAKRLKEELGIDIGLINLCLRAEYDPTDEFGFDFRTRKGQYLWAEARMRSYARAKIADNPMIYNALYQQRPIDGEGILIKREWINRYAVGDQPETYAKVIISVDTSGNDKSTSDKCAIGVFGVTKTQDYYLLDVFYDRISFLGTLSKIEEIIKKYPRYSELLIEAKANGQGVIESLSRKYSRVIPIDTTESKKARTLAVSPVIESGKLWLPKSSTGDEVLEQLVNFKGEGKHEKDDLVDIITQVIRRVDSMFHDSFEMSDISVIRDKPVSFALGSIARNTISTSVKQKSSSVVNKYGKGKFKWL